MSDAIPNPTLLPISDTDRTIPNTAEDVRGRKVIDTDGEDLGKVSDLLVDDTASHVRFLVVEHGGILGIGASRSYLPVEMITSYSDKEVFVNTDRRAVAGAPNYDPEIGPPEQFYENTYGYYGYPPFWLPGRAPEEPWYGDDRRID